MPERIVFPEWRRQNEPTRYPFSSEATLTGTDGTALVEGTFLDAALYPVGASTGLYLASAEIDHQAVTLSIADATRAVVASGRLPLVGAPDTVVLADAGGRPAGVLISESARLGIFQSWGVGLHEFGPEATEFAATCCFPTPEAGVRGIALVDGSVFVGDVWLVGDDGVVLRAEEVMLPAGLVTVVRVDVVGDPLFRRRLCVPTDLFTTPNPVRRLRVVGPNQSFECVPDGAGNVLLTAGSGLVGDPVLRIVTSAGGITVAAVGA